MATARNAGYAALRRWALFFIGIILCSAGLCHALGGLPAAAGSTIDGNASPEAQVTAAARIVRVGVYHNPPLIYQDEAGQWQGIYVDLLEYIAARELWQLEWQPCAWSDCLQGVSQGSLDLLVSIAYSDERAQRMAFTQQTVLANWGQIYVRPGLEAESLLDLEGRVLVGMAQDVHWIVLRNDLDHMDVAYHPVQAADFEGVFEALDAGRADAGVVSRTFGVVHAGRHDLDATPIIVNPIPLRFAAPLDARADLLDTLDHHLEILKAQDDSVYHRALQQHLAEGVVTTAPAWLRPAAIMAGVLLAGAGGVTLRASQRARRGSRVLAHETAQREEAEHALQATETRYRLIYDHLSEVICLLDARLCIQDISPSVQPFLGYSPGELVGRSVRELLPEDALARLSEDTAGALDNTGDPTAVYPLLTRDGSVRYGEITAVPWRDEHGETGLLVVSRDITQRVRAEDELRKTRSQLVQAHKMESIALLAGGVAHDFNNMLTAIRGNIELALLGVEQGSRLQADLVEALHSADRAANLTRQLLLFSHQQSVEMTPTDLGDVVRDMLKMLQRLIGEDIIIRVDICPDPALVSGDAGQLQQVLMNLCLNARDAMPDGGDLTIQVDQVTLDAEDAPGIVGARPGRFMRLAVSDTGTGIPSEVQERIFEPFFTTKAPGLGTGLGLSVTYAIVQDHEGWINVYSEPGYGTTFRIYLPVLAGEAAQAGAGHEALPGAESVPKGHGERILLVEDEDDVRRFAATALASHGYEVHEATSMGQALALCGEQSDPFDLLFSDVILSDGTGLDLVLAVEKQSLATRVLLTSGYTGQRSYWRRVQEQNYPFISKPYGLAHLLAAVQQALSGDAPPRT